MANANNWRAAIVRQEPGFGIALLSSDAVFQNWGGIRELMEEAFSEANYNGSFLDGDPVRDTYVEVNPSQPKRDLVQHVVAIDVPVCGLVDSGDSDLKPAFLGALFSVYKAVPSAAIVNERICTEPGWFFSVARLHGSAHKLKRRAVADAIIETMHQVLKEAGFTHVEAEIGTAAGVRCFCSRFDYMHEPVSEQDPWVAVRRKHPDNHYVRRL